MDKHTPGPWFVDKDGNVWRRDPKTLYQNGGGVAGDRPLASAHRGWYGATEIGFPVEANGRLIASAPDLLEAARDCIAALGGIRSDSVPESARAAIAKATGEATC